MWTKVERNDHVQEYFRKGEYVQSDTWKKSNPPRFKARYSKEEVRYPYQKDNSYAIQVCELMHATRGKSMINIVHENGFRPGEKIIPGLDLHSFIWFSIHISETEIDSIRLEGSHRAMNISRSLNYAQTKLATSAAFDPRSRYGNFKFTFEMKEVIDAYRDQFCKSADVSFRKMGTFAFKQETEHVVLVCPSHKQEIKELPVLGKDTNVIQECIESRGRWIWRPHSTRKGRRRWENVAFAFYVPEKALLKLPDLRSRFSLCVFVDMMKGYGLRSVNIAIMEVIKSITSSSSTSTDWFNALLRILRGYLDDEALYLKIRTRKYDALSTDTLSRVFGMLNKRLTPESVDWTPLRKYVESAQVTENNQEAYKAITTHLQTFNRGNK